MWFSPHFDDSDAARSHHIQHFFLKKNKNIWLTHPPQYGNLTCWFPRSVHTHKMENFPIKLWINSLKNLIKRWSSITKCFKQSSIWAWSFLCYHYDLELSLWPCTITHLELSHDLDFSGHQNIPYISN